MDTGNRHTGVTSPFSISAEQPTVTDPKNATWTYQFNAHDEQEQLTQPDGRVEQLYYDPAGNRAKKIDGNGATILYEYDALDRPTKVDYPTGTDTLFTYDAMGRRTLGPCFQYSIMTPGVSIQGHPGRTQR